VLSAPAGRIVEDEADLAALVRAVRVAAVIGMKDERSADTPAFGIPQIVQARGIRVIPVNPRIRAALGETAYPVIGDVPDAFDLVDVFRRAAHVPAHAAEILALPAARRPRVVWLQTGIVHEAAAARLAAAGIDVVMDRCLGVYVSRYLR
jgi:predicted CoA-binding protein